MRPIFFQRPVSLEIVALKTRMDAIRSTLSSTARERCNVIVCLQKWIFTWSTEQTQMFVLSQLIAAVPTPLWEVLIQNGVELM